MVVSLFALRHQPIDPVAPWYNEHSRQLVGSDDVVAAILMHFRALDTIGEVVVFAIATIGVVVLIQIIREGGR